MALARQVASGQAPKVILEGGKVLRLCSAAQAKFPLELMSFIVLGRPERAAQGHQSAAVWRCSRSAERQGNEHASGFASLRCLVRLRDATEKTAPFLLAPLKAAD